MEKIQKIVWVAGRTYTNFHWELMGIFSTKERAVEACTLDNDFVAAVEIDKKAPAEPTQFPDAFFPKGKSYPE